VPLPLLQPEPPLLRCLKGGPPPSGRAIGIANTNGTTFTNLAPVKLPGCFLRVRHWSLETLRQLLRAVNHSSLDSQLYQARVRNKRQQLQRQQQQQHRCSRRVLKAEWTVCSVPRQHPLWIHPLQRSLVQASTLHVHLQRLLLQLLRTLWWLGLLWLPPLASLIAWVFLQVTLRRSVAVTLVLLRARCIQKCIQQ